MVSKLISVCVQCQVLCLCFVSCQYVRCLCLRLTLSYRAITLTVFPTWPCLMITNHPLTHSTTHPPHSRSTSYYEPLNHCTDLESGIVREFTATVNRDAPYVVHTRLHNGADFSVNQLYQLDAVPALGYYHRIRNGMRIQVTTNTITHQCTSRVCARVNKARRLYVGVRMVLVHLLLLPLLLPPLPLTFSHRSPGRPGP